MYDLCITKSNMYIENRENSKKPTETVKIRNATQEDFDRL